MKIKTFIQYLASIYAILFLIIGYVLYSTVVQINIANKRDDIAIAIVKDISELRYLTLDYVLHHEERAWVQWQVKYSSISRNLDQLEPLIRDDKELFNKLQNNKQEIHRSFLNLTSVFNQAQSETDTSLNLIIRDRSLDQLLIKSQEMISRTILLENSSRAELIAAQQTIVAFVSLFFIFFSLGLGIVLTLLNKRIIEPLSELQATIVSIIRGNFNHKVPIKNHDEIGDLAANFNHMVDRLNKSYASIETELNQRITAEQKLRKSEERYRRLIETSPDAIIMCDLEGIVQIADPQALFMYGYQNSDEVVGKTILNLILPDEHELFRSAIKDIIEKGKIENLHYTSLKKDGKRLKTETNASAIYDESGKPEAIIAVARDITQRRLNEKKAHELAAIVESSQDAIIGKDLNSNIISWNKAAERLYGYTEAEIIGKPISILIPKDQPNEENEIMSKIKKGELIEHFETKRVKKNGTIIDVSLTISPIKNEHGKVVGVSKIARDISDRKNIEQMKADFFWMATHQLRTPLSSIKWSIELLLDANKYQISPEVRDKLLIIQTSASRMVDQIKEILSISRMQLFKFAGKKETINLLEIIDALIKDADLIIKKKNIDISVKTEKNTSLQLIANVQQIKDIFQNLIANALKYNVQNGKVVITISSMKNMMQIAIEDTGIGIPSSDRDKIFTRFFRATNVKDSEGTGLGLALIKEYINMMGGMIRFESSENKGTTFYLTIPYDTLKL